MCSSFQRAQTHKWRTFLFLKEFKHAAVENDVTYVAQLSFDRLQMVEELSKLWDGTDF